MFSILALPKTYLDVRYVTILNLISAKYKLNVDLSKYYPKERIFIKRKTDIIYMILFYGFVSCLYKGNVKTLQIFFGLIKTYIVRYKQMNC